MKNNLTGKKSATIIAAVFLLAISGIVAYFLLKAPNPLTADEFSRILQSEGFYVRNRTDEDGIDPKINKAVIVAVKGDLYLQFRSFSDEEHAKKFYANNSSAYVDQYTGKLSEKSNGEFETVRLKSDMGRYFIVSRIDKTVIVAETYNSYFEDMNKVFEKLGY